MAQTQLLEYLEHSQANAVVLIIQARDKVREELSLMVLSIGQPSQKITDCSVEAFAGHHAAIADETCEVVQVDGGVVELLDRDNVRVTEADHVG